MKEPKGKWAVDGCDKFTDTSGGKLTYCGDLRPRIKFYNNGDPFNYNEFIKLIIVWPLEIEKLRIEGNFADWLLSPT